MPSSRFGRQPAFAAIYRCDLNIKSAAEKIGVRHSHLLGAVNGQVPPSDIVRAKLPGLVGVELAALFTEAALSVDFAGVRGPKPGWKDALLAEGGVV